MFFRKIKKYVEENFASKRELENIKTIASDLNNRFCSIRDENDKMKRILKNYQQGKITGFSVGNKVIDSQGKCFYYNAKTYVYKDAEEYVFSGLYLENPVFEQGERDNIVFATSEKSKNKYVIDLRSNRFIHTEEYHKSSDTESVECDDSLIDVSVKIDSKKLGDILKDYQVRRVSEL